MLKLRILALLILLFKGANAQTFDSLAPTSYKFMTTDSDFNNALPFSEGMAIVYKDFKMGFIDSTGHLAIPYKYDMALPFEDGIAVVTVGEKSFAIDKSGKKVSEKFDWIRVNQNKLIVEKDDKVGAIDMLGNTIISFGYQQLEFIEEGFIKFFPLHKSISDYHTGVMNSKEEVVIPPDYMNVEYSEGIFMAIRGDDKCAFFDKKGKQLTDFKWHYMNCTHFQNGLAVVGDGNTYQIIDTAFNTVRDGLRSMPKINEPYFIIGETPIIIGVAESIAPEKWKIPPIYDQIDPIEGNSETYSCLEMDSGFGLVTIENEIVIPLEYSGSIQVKNEVAILSKHYNLYGCYFLETKQQIPCAYDAVIVADDGKSVLLKDGDNWKLVNSNNVELASELKLPRWPKISEGKLIVKDLDGNYEFIILE